MTIYSDRNARAALLCGEETHLWILHDQTDCLHLLPCLSAAEQMHYHRLNLPAVKREYLSARALVRHCLSWYADVAPSEWQFITTAYGKPLLAAKFAHLQLHFNITHSKGTVACLLACGHQVGVDLEHLNTTAAVELEAILSPHELARLARRPGSKSKRMLYYWTLKEAYTKTLGYGLSMPFNEISCEFNDEDASPGYIRLNLPRWQFSHLIRPNHCLIATAIHKTCDSPVAIRLFESAPWDQHLHVTIYPATTSNRIRLHVKPMEKLFVASHSSTAQATKSPVC